MDSMEPEDRLWNTRYPRPAVGVRLWGEDVLLEEVGVFLGDGSTRLGAMANGWANSKAPLLSEPPSPAPKLALYPLSMELASISSKERLGAVWDTNTSSVGITRNRDGLTSGDSRPPISMQGLMEQGRGLGWGLLPAYSDRSSVDMVPFSGES